MEALMAFLPVIIIAAGFALTAAVRVALGPAGRDTSQPAGDPFFFPYGEMPIVPRERHLIAADFRAWGIPSQPSARAPRRKEDGGRKFPASAVVLTFPGVKRNG
jgi:hypothetical protein